MGIGHVKSMNRAAITANKAKGSVCKSEVVPIITESIPIQTTTETIVEFRLVDPGIELTEPFRSTPLGEELPVGRLADKWVYVCQYGHRTPSFIGKRDKDSIPAHVEAAMQLHAETHAH
jgi:hypothetical protein